MPKFILKQTNFNGGEISPRLHAREDLQQYDNSLETVTNILLTPHGPAFRRTGSQFKAETKTSSDEVRLMRFQFNEDEAYILEFGDSYIRFYTDSAQVESGGSPYEISTPYSPTDVQTLSYTQFGNTVYIAHPSYAPRILTRIATTNWTLTTLDLSPPPTVENGFSPAATVTPAATTGTSVVFTASASSFVQGDVGRQILNLVGTGVASITAYTSATQVTCEIVEDFPNTSAIASGDWKMDLSPLSELTPDGTRAGSIITLDADDIGTTTALNSFRSADVGKYVLLNNGVVRITQVVSGSQVKGEVLKSLDSLDETANWTLEEEAWSASRGYPQAVGFYQERLVFGGTAQQPQTLWLSEAGIFDGFGAGANDSDSIEIELSSYEVNQISWLASGRDLVVGTSGSEITISAGTSGGVTPSNITQQTRTYFGSSVQTPIVVGNEIIFKQRSKRKLRSFSYSFEIDNYDAQDLTRLAEHITEGLVKETAYAQEPDSVIYSVLEDGTMLVGTYDRSSQVLGWGLWNTDGEFENVETITVGQADQVWVVVKRTINGTTKRFVELFEADEGTENYLAGFSDSFLTYSDPKTITAITQANPGVVTTSGAHGYSNGDTVKLRGVGGMTEVIGITYTVANATSTTFELSGVDTTGFSVYTSGGTSNKLVTTVSGLGHLEGKSVQVKADGGEHPNETVTSGSITLDRPSYNVVVGLSYTSTVKTLRPPFDIGMGSMQGQRVRRVKPILRVHKSIRPTLNGEYLPARTFADTLDEAVPLFTGDLYYNGVGWDNTGQLTIQTSSPHPMRVLGIFGTADGGVN